MKQKQDLPADCIVNDAYEPFPEWADTSLRDALKDIALKGLQPVTSGLIILYLVLGASHLLFLPQSLALTMGTTALGTVLILAAFRYQLQRRSVSRLYFYPVGMGIVGLIMLNCYLHLYLSAEPQQTTNLMLVVIAVGFFFLSTLWFVVAVALIVIGWIILALLLGPSPLWVHFSFALSQAVFVAVLLHIVHVHNLRRLAGMHLKDTQNEQVLRKTLADAEQARQSLETSQKALQKEIARRQRTERERERLIQELRLQAENDPLTGVSNRRTFFKRAEHELQRARRLGRPLSIIMLDIDHFKRINDTYGHGKGDEVICRVAACCRLHIRNIDLLGRYGGEEFVILAPETDCLQAQHLAERLRAGIESIHVDAEHSNISVTASFGIAAIPPETIELSDLFNRADAALYAAKNNGRNCVAAA